MEALPDLLDLLDLLVREVAHLKSLPQLPDPLLVSGCRDGDDALGPAPQDEDGGGVGAVSEPLRNLVKDGGKGTALGRVAKDGGEGTVGFYEDALALADVEDRGEVREDEGVVLELCRKGLDQDRRRESMELRERRTNG